MKNIAQYLSQGSSQDYKDASSPALGNKAAQKRMSTEHVLNPQVLAQINHRKSLLSKKSQDASADAVNQVLHQIVHPNKAANRAVTLGLLNDPLRKIPRYQKDIIQSSLLSKSAAKGGRGKEPSIYHQPISNGTKSDCRNKKTNRNVIVRRLKSSQMSSVHQSQKSMKHLDTSIRSLTKLGSKAEISNESRPQIEIEEKRDGLEVSGIVSKRKEHSPVGQEMLDIQVHAQAGLTGDQIIELTELAHQKEMERNRETAALHKLDNSSSDNESCEDDPLAEALGLSASKGISRSHNIGAKSHAEQGSGAKRIKCMLAFDENEEEIQEDQVNGLLRQKTMDRMSGLEKLEIIDKEGGKPEEAAASKQPLNQGSTLQKRQTLNLIEKTVERYTDYQKKGIKLIQSGKNIIQMHERPLDRGGRATHYRKTEAETPSSLLNSNFNSTTVQLQKLGNLQSSEDDPSKASSRLVLPKVKNQKTLACLPSNKTARANQEPSKDKKEISYSSLHQKNSVLPSRRNNEAEPLENKKKNGFAYTATGGFPGLKGGDERQARSFLKKLPKPTSLHRNISRQLLDETKLTNGPDNLNKPSVPVSTVVLNIEEKPAELHSFIPRTGIEQPFLLTPPSHIRDTNDLERINDISSMLKMAIIEDYRLRESSRVINLAKTVYDAERESPHYRNQLEYIDPVNQVRITKSTVNGRPIENPRATLKNRYFKELNPWYVPYQYSSAHSRAPSSKDGKSYPSATADQDDVLIFESRFESGNLKEAIQLDRNEYELVLKPDYGTKNFTQWFYFKISNTRKHREYIFHIINFVKPDSLFNDGMMPLLYSRKQAEQSHLGWYRGGYDIAYYQNNQPYCKIFGESQSESRQGAQSTNTQGKSNAAPGLTAPNQKEPSSFYTLSFKFTLKHDHDDVFIAMCYPYTYSQCLSFLDGVMSTPESPSIVRRTTLCKTLAGNHLDMLILTNFLSSQDSISRRKCIILTGRVHPGESNSSYIMEGLIQFLVSSDEAAVALRDRFIFKIVPMLNPDGVVVGNYRCSLSAHDLNRQYIQPSAKLFPEVFAVKQMLRKTLDCRRVELYCDFHGHSRQKDLFMYGCSMPAQSSLFSSQSDSRTLKERVFPLMFDRKCNHFNYAGSSFNVQKAKESTGRVVMWKEFQLTNSYTCEASFCGPSQGYFKGFHFNIKMLLDMGKEFCKTLQHFSEPDQLYFRQILNELHFDFTTQQTDCSTKEDVQGEAVTARGRGRRSKTIIKDKKDPIEHPLRGILNVTSKGQKANRK